MRVEEQGTFQVEQTVDSDGWARLSLVGELDHATSEGLIRRLGELKTSGEPARLDLSRLEFIDSSGVRAVLITLREARRDAWQLEIDPEISWQTRDVFQVLGLEAMLWPDVT